MDTVPNSITSIALVKMKPVSSQNSEQIRYDLPLIPNRRPSHTFEYDGTARGWTLVELAVDLKIAGKVELDLFFVAVGDNSELVLDCEAKTVVAGLRELCEGLDRNFRIGHEDSVVIGITETAVDIRRGVALLSHCWVQEWHSALQTLGYLWEAIRQP